MASGRRDRRPLRSASFLLEAPAGRLALVANWCGLPGQEPGPRPSLDWSAPPHYLVFLGATDDVAKTSHDRPA